MVISFPDSNIAIRAVEGLQNRGLVTACMTCGSTSRGDSVGVFTAVGPRTHIIMFGTAIA